jgi:acyl dehydratase
MPGKYFEDFEIGARYKHATGRTVTEMDNVLFCAITMNPQPLHINADFASRTPFGQRVVNGLYTLSLIVGLTVAELTEGTIIANLSYDRVNHVAPVFHGDTLYAETEVLEKRESKSHPDRGIIRFKHIGRNQNGDVVVELERAAMFLKRPRGSGVG